MDTMSFVCVLSRWTAALLSRIAALFICSLSLQTENPGLSTGIDRDPCINGWTDRDVDSSGPNEACIRWGCTLVPPGEPSVCDGDATWCQKLLSPLISVNSECTTIKTTKCSSCVVHNKVKMASDSHRLENRNLQWWRKLSLFTYRPLRFQFFWKSKTADGQNFKCWKMSLLILWTVTAKFLNFRYYSYYQLFTK